MPKRRYLKLSESERAELEQTRDKHAKAHMREKGAILLKIADGMSPHKAAIDGGLKPHHPDTIYKWMDEYESGGVSQLEVQSGRGRKASFSPSP